jgi:hypothetical protein
MAANPVATATALSSRRSGVQARKESRLDLCLFNMEAEPMTRSKTAAVSAADVAEVFEAWQASTGKLRTAMDGKREAKIRAALALYPLADVLDAVDGWRFSEFHSGTNDRATVYNDLGLLLRDASKVEYFRDMKRDEPWMRGKRVATAQSASEIRAAIARGER